MIQKIVMSLAMTIGMIIFSSTTQASDVDNSAAEKEFFKSQSQLVIENRDKLLKISEFVQKNPILEELRKKDSVTALTNDEREMIRETWASLIRHHANLDLIIKAVDEEEELQKSNAFKSDEYYTIKYAAFLAQYRSAIEFIRAMRKVPSVDKVLNEPNTETGILKDTFKSFKYEYLHIEKFSEFFSYRMIYIKKDMEEQILNDGIEKDTKIISQFNKYKGAGYTLRNAGSIVKSILFRMYFPLQKNISEWMGDERVARGDEFLITPEQIKEVHSQLRSGDVLIERREWYLSNIGLPGFWPHAALYLGRPEERSHLEQDESIRQWVREEGISSGSFEELLANKFPEVYEESLGNDQYSHPYRVLEAMSEGVVFTSLEHSADADSLAVIRPKLSNLDIAKGILTSLKYKGRPYDFNFDFRTDAQVVCSELIFYAFQPTKHKNGITFPVTETLGRPVVTPNNIIKDLAENYGTQKQQFDFVLFLDGNDKKRVATFREMEDLKTTWNRPKWFIFTQNKDESK